MLSSSLSSRHLLSSVTGTAAVVLLVLLAGCLPLVFCTAPPSADSSPSSSGNDGSSRELYCALCEAVMDEMESAIARIEAQHSHTVQTAWRIDEKKRIPYARTESVLLQLLEDDVPPLLRHYGVTNHTGRQRLVRRADAPQLDTAPLLPGDEHSQQNDAPAGDGSGESGSNISSSSASYSASEFSSSPLLSDTLTALYNRMIDSYLEDIMLAFHKRQHDNVKDALCVRTIRACRKGTTFEPFRRPARHTAQAAGGGQTVEQIGHVEL